MKRYFFALEFPMRGFDLFRRPHMVVRCLSVFVLALISLEPLFIRSTLDTRSVTSQENMASESVRKNTIHGFCPLGAPLISRQRQILTLALETLDTPTELMRKTDRKDRLTKRKSADFFVGIHGGWILDLPHSGVKLTYLRVFKNANNHMRCFGSALSEVIGQNWTKEVDALGNSVVKSLKNLPSNETPVIFMLVRDPLSHFVSAFTEHVWRQSQVINETLSTSLPVDSPGFFQAYVERTLIDTFTKRTSMGSAFDHVWSQVAYFHHLNLIGVDAKNVHIEDISKASEIPMILANLFNLTDIPERFSVERSCGQHKTSQDPLNTTKAALEVLRDPRSPHTQAVCLLHVFDYACLPQYLDDENACLEVFLAHHERLKDILSSDESEGDPVSE